MERFTDIKGGDCCQTCSHFEDFARAHAEAVGGSHPVATMVQVQQLVDPLHLIEIEVDAIASGSPR